MLESAMAVLSSGDFRLNFRTSCTGESFWLVIRITAIDCLYAVSLLWFNRRDAKLWDTLKVIWREQDWSQWMTEKLSVLQTMLTSFALLSYSARILCHVGKVSSALVFWCFQQFS